MDADFAAGGPLAATEEKRWRGAIGDGSEEVSAALRTRADRASAVSSDLQVTDSKSIRSKTRIRGSGASADNSLRSAAEALKGTLVSDVKRLEIRHFCFAACGSSIRQEVL